MKNYRSPDRIGKSPKRYFTDPSLACTCLDLTKEKLINDLKTFGFMFEAMVERDLRIYIEYLNGKLFSRECIKEVLQKYYKSITIL